MSKMPLSLIVFDGDDTLWLTQVIYGRCKAAFFDLLAAEGFDRSAVESRFSATDLANVATLKLSRHRFPKSMVDTYHWFCAAAGRTPDAAIEDRARAIGYDVFNTNPELVPDAVAVLKALRAAGKHRIVLMTAGDLEVQERRIKTSGLREYFDAIYIPEIKREQDYRDMLAKEGVAPADAWMIGNSAKSDIVPADACGMNTALLASGSSWAYDKVEAIPARTLAVSSLTDFLAKVLPAAA